MSGVESRPGIVVLICGGRNLPEDDGKWFNMLGQIEEHYGPFRKVIHGGASGADNIGKHYAVLRGLPCVEYRANWQHFGKRAGPLRNQIMLDEGSPDLVVALPGGRGTADMIARARGAGVRVVDVCKGPVFI